MTRLQALLAGDIKPGLYRFDAHVALDELCRQINEASWVCFCIEGHAVSTRAAFLNAFAAALHFPAYFGHNWDAFEECLMDLPPATFAGKKGIIILYQDAGNFIKAEPKEWATAHGIFTNVITAWHKSGTSMLVLLHGNSDETSRVRNI